MKRARPPQLPDPVAPRRRRALSDEERDLWDGVARHIRPLRTTSRTPSTVADAAAVSTQAEGTAKPAAATLKPARPPVDTPPPLAPLGRRERAQLSRGRRDIEARLDLHGMTQTRAHRALLGFLQRASHDGLTFVLVITGKGRSVGAESERGVLRRQVPEWLALPEFRSLVVGFEEAHVGHGGAGALYVRVRRRR